MFAPGRVTAIVGPNGVGKTTLLRLMLGLLEARSGRVEIDGRGVRGMSARERAKRMAYVPQRSVPAFAYSVRQVVALGRHALGPGDGGAVTRAMERTGIADLGERAAQTLSTGQLQRVALARALAQLDGAGGAGAGGSRYLLADEPTGAMDPWHSLRSLGILREVAGRGVGVVVVLHDLTSAARVADEALLLDGMGQAVAQGAAGEVLTSERLERAFGVAFERVEGAGGVIVVPRLAHA